MRALAEGLYASPYLLLALAMLFWGGNAVAAGMAIGEISPVFLMFMRWFGTAIILGALYGREALAHMAVLRGRFWELLAMACAGFSIYNAMLYASAPLGASSINIGILQGSIPVMVLLGAVLLQGARISLLAVIGVAITLVGVVVVASKGAPARLLETGLNPGDATMLLGCMLYSTYTLGLNRRPAMPGRAFFTVLALIAALTAAPMALGEAALGYFRWPSEKGWMLVAFVIVFPSILSQLFFLRGVDLIGPGRASVFMNLIPVFAALLSVVILGEDFRPFHAIALTLVLGGLWLSQRPHRRERRAPRA